MDPSLEHNLVLAIGALFVITGSLLANWGVLGDEYSGPVRCYLIWGYSSSVFTVSSSPRGILFCGHAIESLILATFFRTLRSSWADK